LTASLGLSVSVVGCTGKTTTNDTSEGESIVLDSGVTGNLMPPPMVEVCVDVTPDEATVWIDEEQTVDNGCVSTIEGSVDIRATAEGYVDHQETIEVYEDTIHSIEMTSETK